MNKETAVAQTGLNAINQVTPYGALTYSQNGAWADGTPRFTATQSLSPEQQQLYDLYNKSQTNLGQIGVEQTDKVRGLLNTPVDLSNEATESRLWDLGRQRLDPMFEQQQKSMEAQLINKGVRPGSEAWARQMTAAGQQKNDAYNQLLLTGRNQSVNEALTERNQPLNEITALMSGSQVQQPSFTNTPTSGIAPTDFIGAQQQSLNQQNVGFQAQQAQNTALMNGLFGLGKTALGGWATGGMV